jgi:hypothetical protein
MSNNLAISPHLVTFHYNNQLSFSLSHSSRRWLSSPWFSGVSKPIRSSSFRVTNTASRRNSIPYLDKLHEGGIEPHLNGYSTPTIKNAPLGPFELDSNRSNTAVNQAKILFQSHELPPPKSGNQSKQ